MKYLFLTILAFLLSCSTIKIEHISKVENFKNNHIIYFLPSTKIEITFTIKEITYKPGPFASYAKKFLGYDNVGLKEKKTYIIEKINVHYYNILDSSNLYVCSYKNLSPPLIEFFSNNYKKLNHTLEGNFMSNHKPFYYNEIFFTRGKESIYYKKIDTTYKTIIIDTIPRKMPIIKVKIDTLNIEEQAYEAANHIFDIRKKRYDLFSGDLDYVPQGEAAKYIYDALNEEENEYLALFLGKHYERELKYSVEVIPLKKPYKEIIGFFSEKYGFNTQQNVLSEPIYIEIIPQGSFTSYYNKFAKVKFKNNLKTIPVRLPITATVLVYLDDTELLYKKNIQIEQWGVIQNIPIKTFEKWLKFNTHKNE